MKQQQQQQPVPLFFPPSAPFPTLVDEALFPAMPYSSRRGSLKTSTHWGQRKLLLSELQLLTAAYRAQQAEEAAAAGCDRRRSGFLLHVVYAGAAPGSHLVLLDAWFHGRVKWTLVDPMPCDACLRSRPNFTLVEDYFTDAMALHLVGQRFAEAGLYGIGAAYCCALDGTSTKEEAGEAVGADAADDHLDAARDRLLFREIGVRSVKACGSPSALPIGLALLANAALLRLPASVSPPLLFVCDIRSGGLTRQDKPEDSGATATTASSSCSANTTTGTAHAAVDAALAEPPVDTALLFETAASFEQHVEADMLAQMRWVDLLLPFRSLLKFRLPYMELYHPVTRQVTHRHPTDTTMYLAGDVLLPIWTRPTSTEGRLLVRTPLSRRAYNNRCYEDQCFFFNSVLRERVHFSDPADVQGTAAAAAAGAPFTTGSRSEVSLSVASSARTRETFLDHRYDGAAEVHALREYLSLLALHDDASTDDGGTLVMMTRIVAKSREITEALGKSFAEASARLPRVMLEKAVEKGFEAAQRALEQAGEAWKEMDVWWRGPTVAEQAQVGSTAANSAWQVLKDQDSGLASQLK